MAKLLITVIILLFGIYNYLLYVNGNIDKYINERFFTFSYYSSIVTIVFCSISIIYLLIKNYKSYRDEIDQKYRRLKENNLQTLFGGITLLVILGLVINSLFILLALLLLQISRKNLNEFELRDTLIIAPILVLIIGFTLPAQSLSSITAYQREGDYNSVSLDTSVKNIKGFTNTSNYGLGDWIASLNYNPDLEYYKGKEVNVTGFVFAGGDSKEDIFLVSRFVVTCCAVDARPVGLKVKYPWKDSLKVDDWVRVSGSFDIVEIGEKQELVIVADKVENIEQPDRPYIY